MKNSLICQLRQLLPAWLICLLLPLPAMLLWHSHDGRCVALWCFFIGCATLAAYAFRPSHSLERSWRDRMTALGMALFSAWIIYSLLWLVLVDAHDFVALFIAFQILIPSLFVVPCMVLVTRQPFAGVVFSLFLVGCMKFIGGAVVVLVYGWHADAHGYTTMPWTHPNLLVWLFWLNSSIFSLSCYILGRRRFMRGLTRLPNPALEPTPIAP
jgi:hypothetical protein